MKTPEQLQAEDDAFESFMGSLTNKYSIGYKKGSFLSFAWMLFKVHRKAKAFDMGSIMTVKLGKDL